MRPTRSRLTAAAKKEAAAPQQNIKRTLTPSTEKRKKGTPTKLPPELHSYKIKKEPVDLLQQDTERTSTKRTKRTTAIRTPSLIPDAKIKKEPEDVPQQDTERTSISSTKRTKRTTAIRTPSLIPDAKIKKEEPEDLPLNEEKKPGRTSRARKVKAEEDPGTPIKKIKTEPGEAIKIPGSFQWKDSKKYIGAHVSMAGGLEKAVTAAVEIGARAFALFLTSQRSWNAKPLDDKSAERFKTACMEHGYPAHLIIPHGSYLLNCGSSKPELLSKSRAKLVDELQRCQRLGLQLYNFHPGSTCGEMPVEECLAKISESINLALDQTQGVTAVVENMSCQGHTVGGKFSELKAIIDGVKDKSRVGVCLDTCHAFAAGYNVATKEGFQAMMAEFESVVGLQYLKAVHINDSKGKLGCHLDRHENIGRGHIGKSGFSNLMQDPRFDNLPLILETPAGLSDAEEIKILHSLE